jgi:hypothetical protein
MREALQLSPQTRHADQKDLNVAFAIEVGFHQGTDLGHGFLGQVVRLVEPQHDPVRLFAECPKQAIERDRVARAGAHAQALAYDFDEARGTEPPSTREVLDAVTGAVQTATQLAQQGGLAGAGLAGDEDVGLVEFAQCCVHRVFDASEIAV